MLRCLFSPRINLLLRTTAAASLTAALLVGVGAPMSGAATADTSPSALVKSVQNVTHPGAAAAEHGDTVNWAVGYRNAADSPAAAPATLTDLITGAGTAQTYLPGSLRTPPGWTPSWSTDGTTFTPTDPGTATTAVRAETPNARPGGTELSAPLLAPVRPTSQSTGGDGFTPILHRTALGEVQSWNIYHHAAAAARQVVCSDLGTGLPCSGGPWPRPLNSTPGPLGSGNTGDIASTLAPQYVEDPQRPGTVYYPGVSGGSVGVGCLDLDAKANCGFFALAPVAGSASAANGLAGLVTTAGNLYGVAGTGQVLCLTVSTRTPCAGQPYAAIVPPNHDLPSTPGAQYMGATTVADGKVFASSAPMTSGSTAALPPALGCFDPATRLACTGWETPLQAAPTAAYYTYGAYTSYDTAGHANGVCTTSSGGATLTTGCFTLAGAPLSPPSSLGGLNGGVLTFNPEVVTANGETRSYFPLWSGGIPGGTICHDWTHAAPCAGFPQPALHPGVNNGVTRDYGYSYDATTRCLIGLGDAGVLFSMDPATGTSPCVHSGATVTLRPSAFYCDGGTGHVQAYTRAELLDIDLSHVDLAASRVSVTDPDGTVLAAPPLTSAGTVDLSGISATAHPAVTVSVQLVLTSTDDFGGGKHPTLTVEYQGDAPQLCFRTVATADCATTQLTNTATGVDVTGQFSSNTVTLAVAPGDGCRPKISVVKEICASDHPHDCGPGGPGPWAKTSPVGLLRLLGTAYWRITVTNSGQVAASGVQINDAVTPACRSAAGTFDLAPGASRQVHCNSFLLALPLKNTASASFVPAGSPPGTTPGTSAPSSAVACSLLCILAGPDQD
ncbi:hypothetical protein OHV05_06215 [Kitasatospora sp. NBC_00070]|uniref:DUF7617 domain-containing protein n=1 Tax=Kitasatospora sp. NBC_00070 TaxID=2975962 RepID=UPI003255665E